MPGDKNGHNNLKSCFYNYLWEHEKRFSVAEYDVCKVLLLKVLDWAGDGQNGKLAVLDISESGNQIGEKLFALLDVKQKQELIQYVLTKRENSYSDVSLHDNTPSIPRLDINSRLTEVQADGLYFCLENRLVYVCETEIMLTVKEFDIFALLIMNPHRILTYDMIMDIVWHEALDFYSRRAINNHVSNLRKKLRITPGTPDYIRSIRDIGYKFNPNIEIF